MRIVHVSDTHVTEGGKFQREVFETTLKEVNGLDADLVLHTGDVTDGGVLRDYELAAELLTELEPSPVVVPGNHDARNAGYGLFEEFFGEREMVESERRGEANLVTLDPTIPDVDEGRLGRKARKDLERSLASIGERFTVVGLHHHLVPVPEAGRERNLIDDAGDVLHLLVEGGTDLVLTGHRHVPSALRAEDTLFVNAGTVSASNVRGHHGHSFNVLDVEDGAVEVTVRRYEDGFEPRLLRRESLEKR